MTMLPELPDTLALFPLAGVLMLPRTRLPLHLFEPRYLALLDDALRSGHRLIGMIQPAGEGDHPRLNKIGCVGRVVSFSETDDGSYLVSLAGVSRFRLAGEIDGFTPYRRGTVDWSGFETDRSARAETDPGMDRGRILSLMRRFFTRRGHEAEWDFLEHASDEMLVNACAMIGPFAAPDKQALLECADLTARRKTLLALMEFALHEPRRTEDTLQ